MAIALVTNVLGAGPLDFDTTGSAIDTSGANFIIIGLTENLSGGYTVGDSKSNTWHPLTAHASDTPDHQLFYAYNATVGSSHTFSATGGAFGVLAVAAFSGVKTSADPFDAEDGRSGGGFNSSIDNIHADAAITPSENNELIIAGLAGQFGGAVTIDAGMTITNQVATAGGNNWGGAIAYKVQGAAASINPEWDSGGNFGGGLSLACFKEATGGATINSPLIGTRLVNNSMLVGGRLIG